VSDVYRDLVMRGGMPDIGFARQLQDGSFFGKNQKEDILAEVERYPLVNDLWENKIPVFDQITVPAYVVASYSNTLHTAGTFRAWRRIASAKKWLRIHNGQEWPDYYDEENREDLRRFFDRYLKDDKKGWEQTPRVRYSLLDLEGGDTVNVAADQFSPERCRPDEVLPRRSRANLDHRGAVRRGRSILRRRVKPERGVLHHAVRPGDGDGRLSEGSALGRSTRR
jgi:predicted acyl esterase